MELATAVKSQRRGGRHRLGGCETLQLPHGPLAATAAGNKARQANNVENEVINMGVGYVSWLAHGGV